jgi:hypothetical protein
MIDQEQVYNFISLMDDTGRMYSCDDGFGFFIKLNDEWLEKIRHNPLLLTNPETMKVLLTQEGKNIHFFGVYSKHNGIHKEFSACKQGIKEIIKKENPDSISWFNKDMSRFIYRRIVCHQHS